MSTSASQPSSVTSTDSEYSPLVAGNQNNGNNPANINGNFYFLHTAGDATAGSQTSGAVHEHERLPYGTTEDEFTPRSVMGGTSQNLSNQRTNRGLFGMIFGNGGGGGHPNAFNPIAMSANLMKKRQAAIKIEPKVFFANERTFLAWLHSSILLAGASVALSSGAKNDLMKQLYSVILLPVAIIFMIYSMRQYGRRSMMIRRRAPGPYEDIIGPSVLAVAIMISIVAQFTLKLYSILS